MNKVEYIENNSNANIIIKFLSDPTGIEIRNTCNGTITVELSDVNKIER